MDPIRIAVRALLAYVFLLALLRLAGKRVLHRATTFDFVLAIVLGDLVDDAIWAEIPFAQFVVGAGSLVLVKLAGTIHKSVGAVATSSGPSRSP